MLTLSAYRHCCQKLQLTVLLTAWVLLLLPSVLSAQSIALIPLLDLSLDPNGTNEVLTERLRQELSQRGRSLIPGDEVMHFLIRNRIRTLSGLTSYQIALLQKELGAELVLQGTVCQLKEGVTPFLSLTLQLSSTADEKIIWSRAESLHHTDMTTLLDLAPADKLEQLYPVFFNNLLSDLPEIIQTGEQTQDSQRIKSLLILPKNLRPGEEVSCKIRLHHPLQADKSNITFSVWANEEEHQLNLDDEEYYHTASWPAEAGEGIYPVTFMSTNSKGEQEKKIIGTYRVDATPPKIDMHLRGKELDGQPAFSKKLQIVPISLEPEPFTNWEISIDDEGGEPIVYQTQGGAFPNNLTWYGATSSGSNAPPGEYTIRLKAWDLVGHEATAEKTVLYQPEPPELTVTVKQEQDQLFLDLENFQDTPLVYWWIKVLDNKDRLIKLAEGDELPATVEIEYAGELDPQLQGILTARDVLGNQRQIRIANLFQQNGEEKQEEDKDLEIEWVEEF